MNLFKKSGRTKAKSVFYCKEVVDTYQKVEKLRDEPPSYMYVVLVDIKQTLIDIHVYSLIVNRYSLLVRS